VHAAGANRGSDEDVFSQNVALAERLVSGLRGSNSRPVVVYTNSTQAINAATPYGESKARAATAIADWARGVGAPFVDYVLPNVFGEHGKPFHNSVVATFAYQIAHREIPNVNPDGAVELVHAQVVADGILGAIEAGKPLNHRVVGERLTVTELRNRICAMSESYDEDVMPALTTALDVQLFNTYRSYLFPRAYPKPLKSSTDYRGSLVECRRADSGGQAFFSTTHPGVTRGNHFHRRKVERFVVISGEAEIALRRLRTDERVSFRVSGDDAVAIDIPTLHTHNITNVGDSELKTIFWSNELFDETDPDTFALAV
jgi:UDP-2-acetamido-2,6-beta-L-arabino-hexul-4-ose reductase